MADEAPTAVKSADRVLDLFELLARRLDGLTHTEIAEALAIPKGSLSQILKNVVQRGYVESGPDKRYRLGAKIDSLGRRTAARRSLVDLGRDTLEILTRRTRESSALNVLNGDKAEVVATISSPQRLVSHMRLGDLAPLYATSGGKIILAHMPNDWLATYLSTVTFVATTPNTLSSKDDLLKELDKIRYLGTAYSFEEYTPGIIGIAKAIVDPRGALLASINIAMPAVRYNPVIDGTSVDALDLAKTDLERSLAG